MDDPDTATTPQPMTDADVSASDFATADKAVTPDGSVDRPGSGGSAPAGGGTPTSQSAPEPAIATGDLKGEGSAGMGGGPDLKTSDDKDDGAQPASIKQTLTEKTGELRGQATGKARQFAEDGKARAAGALDELAKMLTDAAGQVDDKLGGQFGQYARSAADNVQGFSSLLNDKSVDDLLETARDFVRKSPAAAIGIASALGFVVARLVGAGLDQRDQA